MVDNLFHAKLPPHLKRSKNLACMKNGTYDKIVAHLQRELELSVLGTDGKVPIPNAATAKQQQQQK